MEWVLVLLSFPGGMLLGLFFFEGLWWTVQRCTSARSPLLLFLASFLVRMAVLLAGFYLLLMQGVPHLFLALAGFLAARFWRIRALNPKEHQKPETLQQHESGEPEKEA